MLPRTEGGLWALQPEQVGGLYIKVTMKTAKRLLAIGVASISAILTSCSRISLLDSDSQSVGSLVYIALQPNSPEMLALNEDILDKISKQSWDNKRIVLDIAKGSTVENVYSSGGSRRAIQEIIDQIKEIPSDDGALTQSVQRCLDQARDSAGRRQVHCLIVTPGTSNPSTHQSIHYLCDKLAKANIPNVHLYFVGVSPSNRIPLATAVKPIAGYVNSAGDNDSEWGELITQF